MNLVPTLDKEDRDFLRAGCFSDDIVTEYMRFMTLEKICDSIGLAPSKAVDAVWCHHILNTKLYLTFCVRNFGPACFVHRDPNKITRANYVATLKMANTIFEGTMFQNAKASQTFWPPDDYLMPLTLNESQEHIPIKLMYTKADLDRVAKDVFGNQPDLVDAHTFRSIYKVYVKMSEKSEEITSEHLLVNGFQGNVSDFKAALVRCHAMHVIRDSVRKLRTRLQEYVRVGGSIYIPLKGGEQGGELIEWLGRFTVVELMVKRLFPF